MVVRGRWGDDGGGGGFGVMMMLVRWYEVKGVTTRGGKITSQVTYDREINETNRDRNEPPRFQPNEQDKPEEFVFNSLAQQIAIERKGSREFHYSLPGIGVAKPIRMSSELADRSIQYPRRIVKNVLIKVDKLVLLIDFVILDMSEDSRILIILGRPFLATTRTMIDVFNKKITLRVGDDEETQKLLEGYQLDSFLLKDLEKKINQIDLENFNSIVSEFVSDSDVELAIWRIDLFDTAYSVEQKAKKIDRIENEHFYSASANGIDGKKPELKDLASHLEHAYLHGFFQIPIAPKDQDKTTFTCPYGTLAYRRMPFRLCNTPATFQRCMTAIFHDMVDDFMEVFMDEFFVFECHFMVKEGIVLGHKLSGSGIEVDKAKIDIIAKLPYPTNVKGVRSFLSDFAIGAVLRQQIDGQDRQMLMVDDNGRNQFTLNAGQSPGNMIGQKYRNGKVVATRAEGNGNRINGIQIRFYNYQGEGHYASNCIVKPKKMDVAYLHIWMQIAQKEEARIQLTPEEFYFMADACSCEDIERVNANCTLEDNLYQASTSVT
ncbi:reverse transcriptase domain-containing protein [Tanacetum coccineum]